MVIGCQLQFSSSCAPNLMQEGSMCLAARCNDQPAWWLVRLSACHVL